MEGVSMKLEEVLVELNRLKGCGIVGCKLQSLVIELLSLMVCEMERKGGE